jgi:hypothetical protein
MNSWTRPHKEKSLSKRGQGPAKYPKSDSVQIRL